MRSILVTSLTSPEAGGMETSPDILLLLLVFGALWRS